MTESIGTLPGEGEIKVVIKTRMRRECESCGELATKKHEFCYINGRRNPASSMYGRDDCTFCSDHDAYACEDCSREVERDGCPDGMNWAGTRTATPRNAFAFLYWSEREAAPGEIQVVAKAANEPT